MLIPLTCSCRLWTAAYETLEAAPYKTNIRSHTTFVKNEIVLPGHSPEQWLMPWSYLMEQSREVSETKEKVITSSIRCTLARIGTNKHFIPHHHSTECSTVTTGYLGLGGGAVTHGWGLVILEWCNAWLLLHNNGQKLQHVMTDSSASHHNLVWENWKIHVLPNHTQN